MEKNYSCSPLYAFTDSTRENLTILPIYFYYNFYCIILIAEQLTNLSLLSPVLLKRPGVNNLAIS
jgi:hypothetical protein